MNVVSFDWPNPYAVVFQLVPVPIWVGDGRPSSVLFCPNCPLLFLPHFHNVPSVLTAAHTLLPTLTCHHVVSVPT